MQTVYFVRHGESEGNIGDVWQDSTASLTKHGRAQAGLLADRLAGFPIDVVISSDMKRALQTADIVADRIKTKVEHSELFNERRRPSEQLGELKANERAKDAELQIKTYFNNPEFRYSDEENFCDLKKRAEELVDFLEGREEKHILVVTHEILMRIILAYIAMGDDLTGEEGKQFFRTFHMENTGITTITQNEGDNKSRWDLQTWNDYSHLGKL